MDRSTYLLVVFVEQVIADRKDGRFENGELLAKLGGLPRAILVLGELGLQAEGSVLSDLSRDHVLSSNLK